MNNNLLLCSAPKKRFELLSNLENPAEVLLEAVEVCDLALVHPLLQVDPVKLVLPLLLQLNPAHHSINYIVRESGILILDRRQKRVKTVKVKLHLIDPTTKTEFVEPPPPDNSADRG